MEVFENHLKKMKEELSSLSISKIVPILKLFNTHNRVVFCTMGKSAFACAKVVYTARSYGLEWYDLDVCHAFHGDAGLIKRGDLLVFVSKSGETKDVIKVAKYFKHYPTIAVVSNQNSKLAKLCDQTLLIPVNEEASPFGYAPMISTTMYMAVLHAVLCEVVENSDLTVADYARNHPDGDIGRQLDEKLSPKNSF